MSLSEPPPSYESSEPSIAIIIRMQHHEPGKLLGPNLMRAGTLIKQQPDIIMLEPRARYFDILKLMHQRVQARSGIRAPSKAQRFLCRLVLVKNKQMVLLEQGSWPAAREMVRACEGATLLFMFAIVPRSYRGLTTLEKVKRAFTEEHDEKICLVEPDLPVHDEPAQGPRYARLT